MFEEYLRVVGFDIIAVGVMVIFGIQAAVQAFHNPGILQPFAAAWRELQAALGVEQSAPTSQPGSTWQALARPFTQLGKPSGLLLAAAFAGMVLNLTADRMLDSEGLRRLPPRLEWKAEGGGVRLTRQEWRPEDAIKLGALDSVRNLFMPDPSLRRNECAKPEIEGYDLSEDYAREVVQQAYVRTSKDGDQNIRNVLGREELFVKLIRVMVAMALILVVAGVLGTAKAAWSAQWSNAARAIGFVLLSLILTAGFLELWSAQSRRYYKKLLHAYLIVDATEAKSQLLYRPRCFYNQFDGEDGIKRIAQEIRERAEGDAEFKKWFRPGDSARVFSSQLFQEVARNCRARGLECRRNVCALRLTLTREQYDVWHKQVLRTFKETAPKNKPVEDTAVKATGKEAADKEGASKEATDMDRAEQELAQALAEQFVATVESNYVQKLGSSIR